MQQSRYREAEGPRIYWALQSTVVGDKWMLEDVFGAGSCYPFTPQGIPTFKNFWFLVLFLGLQAYVHHFLKAALHEDTSFFWPCGEFYATNPT